MYMDRPPRYVSRNNCYGSRPGMAQSSSLADDFRTFLYSEVFAKLVQEEQVSPRSFRTVQMCWMGLIVNV